MSNELKTFQGIPECIVCQQFNLVQRIMADIDAQPDCGGALYDDAVSSIYTAADEALSILRHEHQTDTVTA